MSVSKSVKNIARSEKTKHLSMIVFMFISVTLLMIKMLLCNAILYNSEE